MSLIRAFRSAAMPLVILASLAACSDGPTGIAADLDVDAVEQQDALLASALQAPVLYSLFGSFETAVGFSTAPTLSVGLSGDGSPLDAARSTGGAVRSTLRDVMPLAAAAAVEGAYVPATIWGRTYVKDPAGGMMWDASRTDAPARGIRVLLYQRTGPDTFGNTSVGALDIIDSSTTALTVGRLNLYDAQGQQVGTFRETATGSVADGTPAAMAATFTGTFGLAPRTFVVADTMSGSQLQSGTTYTTNLRWHSVTRADFARAAVSILATGVDLGNESQSGQVEMTFTMGDHVTRIVGTGGTDGSVAGTVRVYIDDVHVASVDETAIGDDPLRAPDGGEVSPRIRSYLMAVLLAAAKMPNALLVRVVIALHIPFF